MNPFVKNLRVGRLLKTTLLELRKTHPQIDKLAWGRGPDILNPLRRRKIAHEICIDPDPNKYTPNARVKRDPDYGTIDEYFATPSGQCFAIHLVS